MSKSTKAPKPPAKVRAGETVSARWMNKVVDCLEAGQAASATAAAAAGSSSINTRPLLRNNKYREPEPRPLPVFETEDFRLRVKPRQFCEADAEGNWAKVLQVHEGHIIDYRGLDLLVPFTGDSGSGSGSGSPDPDNPTPGPTPAPTCNCDCVEYTFDPAYFIVQDHNVSLNTQAISGLVDEVLGEISVDVNVEGLVEHTEYGELKASGQGSAPGGVDSRISY